MQCEGSRFVPVATKEEVIYSHPRFARYNFFHSSHCPLQAAPLSWIPQVAVLVCLSQKKNDSWITNIPSDGEGVASLAFSNLQNSPTSPEKWEPGYAQQLMQDEGNRLVSCKEVVNK